MRADSQEQEDRLLRIFNDLLLACARKRRMEDATFLLHSADQYGLDLSLHHVQVNPQGPSGMREGRRSHRSVLFASSRFRNDESTLNHDLGTCICPGRSACDTAAGERHVCGSLSFQR